MAASAAALPASAARYHEDDTSDLVKKTSAEVYWTPGAADITRPLSSPSPSITLLLRVCYHVPSNQAFFELQLRNVALKGEKNKKAFHLHIRPEDIDSLGLKPSESSEWSESMNSTVYRLALVLRAPPHLIGPKSHGYEMGWLGKHKKSAQLISLAEALHLTILLPTAAAKKDELLSFCKAASTQRGLQSLAGLYDVRSLYGGDGGHVYVPAHTQAPAVPQDAPGEVPDRLSRGCDADSPASSQIETESDEPTVPASTPSQYRDPPPEYCDENGSRPVAKRQIRHGSEVGSPPPLKRRHCAAGEEGEAANDDTPRVITEAAKLLSHSPHLHLIPLFETLRKEIGQFTNKVETQDKTIAQLTNKLETQDKKIAQLTDEVSELTESQDEVGFQVAAIKDRQELLEVRADELDEDYNEVRKELPDIHCEVEDAIRDHIGDALKKVVKELLEDIFEDQTDMLWPGLEALIDARIKDIVGKHFARFQARFNRACEE